MQIDIPEAKLKKNPINSGGGGGQINFLQINQAVTKIIPSNNSGS
tara:strand:- start:169 stop:303 length:135 start_codon:yes stop_codon:yes gene_type:complete